MKRILFSILFFSLSITLYAQSDTTSSSSSKESFLRRVDSFVAKIHEGNKMDSAYVAVPSEIWAVRLASEVSQSWIDGRGVVDGDPLTMYLRSKFRFKERITVGYRNIALGVAVDPVKLLGGNGGITAGLTSYGNRIGFKTEYHFENSYHGNVTYGEESSQLKDITAGHQAVDVDVYFVLNRKYSVNSVFGLSYIQKKSAGSLYFTASGSIERTYIKQVESMGTPHISTEGIHFGLGVGYGYNYVMPKGWLLHGSVLPSLLVLNKGDLTVGQDSRAQKGHITDFTATANLGVMRHAGVWFGGATLTFREMGIGKSDIARVDHVKYFVRICVGKRF